MQETKKIDASSITNYEQAIDFLGYENEASLLGVFHNATALIAMEKLITIAEAWNKLDEFIPDFDNRNQVKWFPWFQKRGNAGFVCASTSATASTAYADFGSRLCFSTSERAEQFGTMFIDLWNEFLLQK